MFHHHHANLHLTLNPVLGEELKKSKAPLRLFEKLKQLIAY
jgi:hypothetical protein